MKTGYPSIDKTHLQGIPEEKLHPEILPASMLATFMKVNDGHFDEMAIEVANGKTYTKQQLRDDAIKFAGVLLKSGLKAGDKLALVAQNCYEGIVATFGANAIGVKVIVMKPVDDADIAPFYNELNIHRPDIIIFDRRSAAWMSAIQSYSKCKIYLTVSPIDPYTSQFFGFREVLDSTEISLEETMKEIEKHSISEKDEPMLYLKTSGSSSKPKTLPFSNRAIFAALIYAVNSTGTDTRDETATRVLCQASYYHGYGWMPLFVNIIGGNPVILAGSAPEDIANYHRLKPSHIYGSPLTLRQFMELTPKNADVSSIAAFYCAGASLHEKDYEDGIKYLREHHSQGEIRNNYGISEGLCIGTVNDHIPHVPGTSGKFYIGPEWMLVDENGNEVKYGEVGETIVSSASLCQGYFCDEENTKKAFFEKDGKTWFKTGDSMILREDGYVKFVGRERRFFIAVGVFEKVNCEVIEQAISEVDSVYQSAVIVTPDETGAKAFVALKSDFRPSESVRQDIISALSKVLHVYQMPREIVFIDKIPMMDSGKINYKLLETMQ